jgi:Arc/MetJ-type ribon-helix-helix transcriptional regulator
MSVAKVSISMDEQTLRRVDLLVKARVFRSRSHAIENSVEEKLKRLKRTRLARECAKLNKTEEQGMAEEGIRGDSSEWPEY